VITPIYHQDDEITIYQGDALSVLTALPSGIANCIVTSPPYWGLRDYGVEGQIGLEKDFNLFITSLRAVFHEARRVLCDDGTLWLNCGDTYLRNTGSGFLGQREGGFVGRTEHKTRLNFRNPYPKGSLVGVSWRLAFALQDDGWILRDVIIWHKPNPLPESVKDRTTKAHEYIFMFAKQRNYYYDHEAIMEPALEQYREKKGSIKYKAEINKSGQNPQTFLQGSGYKPFYKNGVLMRAKRSVWTVVNKGTDEGHYATYPVELIEPCILAGCPKGGVVLDPFSGSGTTGLAAVNQCKKYIGIELNPEYCEIQLDKLRPDIKAFGGLL
jgi:DNA modification methylase